MASTSKFLRLHDLTVNSPKDDEPCELILASIHAVSWKSFELHTEALKDFESFLVSYGFVP